MFKRLNSGAVKTVLTFPGQGKLISPELLPILQESHDLTKFKSTISSQISPQFSDQLLNLHQYPDLLYQSSYLQPAAVSISLLLIEIAKLNGIELKADYLIGHSLGELTCLLVNNVLNPEYGPLIAHKRGLFMEKAVDTTKQYGMTALLYNKSILDETIIREVLENYKSVAIANQNLPTQTVLSGESKELKLVIKDINARLQPKKSIKAIPLKVKIPFHNELLKESKTKFKEFLQTQLPPVERDAELEIPIISNLTGGVVTTHGEALDNFIEDFTNPVLFATSIEGLLNNPEDKFKFINFGPNADIIQGLIRKLETNNNVIQNSTLESIDDMKLLNSFD